VAPATISPPTASEFSAIRTGSDTSIEIPPVVTAIHHFPYLGSSVRLPPREGQ
jgi:hypothetical protein